MTTPDHQQPTGDEADFGGVQVIVESLTVRRERLNGIMWNMRYMETDNDPRFEQRFRNKDGDDDFLVTAYAIPLTRWRNLAAAAGVEGADWRDPAAQDYVVRSAMDKLLSMAQATIGANKRGLGTLPALRADPYEQVAVSFKYGQDVSSYLLMQGRYDPDAIREVPGLEAVADYSEIINGDYPKNQEWNDRKPISRRPFLGVQSGMPDEDARLVKAKGVIGGMMQAIRDSQGTVAGDIARGRITAPGRPYYEYAPDGPSRGDKTNDDIASEPKEDEISMVRKPNRGSASSIA